MNDITNVLDLWLNNDDAAYADIIHNVTDDEDLQDYVLGMFATLPAWSLARHVVEDMLGYVQWSKLFKSIKGI